MAKHDVKIYTTPTCVYCRMTKEFFKQNGVAYKEVDVAADEKAAMQMIEKSGQMGVPVIEIDDKTIIVGYDKEALRKALELS